MSPIFPQPKGCGSETLHLTLRAPYFHQLRCIQRNGSFKNGYLKEFFGFDISLVGPAIFLYFMKKTAKNDRFSVLGNTFQGQKHGFKDFEVS